jgi:hypothetical protein
VDCWLGSLDVWVSDALFGLTDSSLHQLTGCLVSGLLCSALADIPWESQVLQWDLVFSDLLCVSAIHPQRALRSHGGHSASPFTIGLGADIS